MKRSFSPASSLVDLRIWVLNSWNTPVHFEDSPSKKRQGKDWNCLPGPALLPCLLIPMPVRSHGDTSWRQSEPFLASYVAACRGHECNANDKLWNALDHLLSFVRHRCRGFFCSGAWSFLAPAASPAPYKPCSCGDPKSKGRNTAS